MLDVEVDPVSDLGSLCGFNGLRAEERSHGNKQEPKCQFPEKHFGWWWMREKETREVTRDVALEYHQLLAWRSDLM